jgi:lysylphosphatidylglycerol synthetase-like protein (DUF2156 family)
MADAAISRESVEIIWNGEAVACSGASEVQAPRVHDAREPRPHSMTGVPLDIRIALLRQHGAASQSYSATFQPELEHFGDDRGFLAYKKVGRTALVLSDPIAPRQNISDLISRFLKEHPDTAFWYVSRPVAEMLAPRGFFISAMGPDTRIDLATYNFSGGKKENLRRAINRMNTGGFVTRESSMAEVGVDKVKAISDAWRQTRHIRGHEVAFLNRPLVLADESDVRRFFTFDRDGKLVAFGFFDPVYEAGQVMGYMCQHSRHLPEADAMVHFAIKRFAIETFQKEGRKVLYLGLSPFAYIESDDEFQSHRNWMTGWYFRFAYKNWLFNRYFYPSKGLEAHKRIFRGVPEQTYYAFNTRPSLPRVLKLARACKVV